jgi:UDP-3-O-[3-hydroxymyristoyl] N-acetylglucosamine deacetylase
MIADPTAEMTPWSRPWTVAAPLSLTGVGLHSGHSATVRVLSAPAGHGLVFHRVDLPGAPAVPARYDGVTETMLSTALGPEGARVRTVEHLLAALWGMGVSDARIEVDGPEVPVLDGSAKPYVEAIQRVGVTVLDGDRPTIALPELAIVDGDKSVSVAPADTASITYVVDFGHPLAGPQILTLALSPKAFATELAPARTFCFERDVEAMQAAGLAKGGSIENAVVILKSAYSSALRFPDELVRHKALDLVGDLALLGASWTGHVTVVKGGHALHNTLARAVMRRVETERHAPSVAGSLR